ncbi:pyruvate kinase [bacterium]|nr:pyruvate kinase [bacterium]
MRRTKIVCTIGPATDDEAILARLMDAGMNVARLNFSHGTHGSHQATADRIRAVAEKKSLPIALLQDLSGPKIRVAKFANGSINLEVGQTFTLTTDEVAGDQNRVSVSYAGLPDDVKVGDRILLADGSIELRTSAVEEKNVQCEVVVGGPLSANKGINLPGSSLSVAALTDKDKRDLIFGLELGVDYVAMSFVRRKADLEGVKEVMAAQDKHAPIIAKIEKHEALEHIDEIIEIAAGVMVARGDLAVETSLERVPLAQKTIIQKCNQAGKPVITATQMLKSMVDNPRPTRAEANDVANAVLDGSDAVMLSEETTIGNYPVQAARTMATIIEVTESDKLGDLKRYHHDYEKATSIAHAVSHGAYEMARDLKAAAIITPTQSGSTAHKISSHRPRQPIIALSPDSHVVRCLNLVWGVQPFLFEGHLTSDEMIEAAKDIALTSGLVNFGDVVVVTAGVPIAIPGTTNIIKVETLN